MRALLSVSDKEGIVEFGKELENLDFEILSTGGTFKLLKENGIKVIEVSDFTKSPELFEGRVKTLHPKIHGGILHKRSDENHIKQAKENEILGIDLVCVNLYPFKKTTIMSDDFDEIIENGEYTFKSLGFKDYHILKGEVFAYKNFFIMPSYDLDFIEKNPSYEKNFIQDLKKIKGFL